MDAADREHVTRAFYRNAHRFRIVALTSGVDAGEVDFCIDTAAGLARVERLIAACPGRAGWRELLAASRSLEGGHGRAES
jgi:spore coat polysaccharide biosynthesis protein SpsF (cytidylyltransferase family)